MGTIEVDNPNKACSEAKIFDEFVDWGRFFRLETTYKEKYKELYEELSNCKQKLQELSSTYQKILNETDFENLKDIVKSLSFKQAVYYATLLEIYEKKLDYVDMYSLIDQLKKDRRAIEKLLIGAKDSKYWRRGSPRIGEICEKNYLKLKRKKARRVAC
ncbi:MAG: hypothetical protein NZ942_03415, partial [Candidatus Aenigmarchaeota archaeon]|nr:hypothetical protein [Candidatus Aenigmarchaeota archaeon]